MMKRHLKSGFTIIELLFATVIFSIILLLALASLVQIGKLYYKGVTTSQTQQTARAIIDELTQSIQLSSGAVKFPGQPSGGTEQIAASTPATANATSYFCIGDTRYSYVIDRQQDDSTSPDATQKKISHVLWADTVNSCGTISGLSPLDLTQQNPGGTNGRELVGAHMRLLKLNIAQPTGVTSTNVWQVDLVVAYGDEDLFTYDASNNRKSCKTAQAGTQFCATSELSTIINRRLQ